MPQFSPGQSKNARIMVTVGPAGLACQLEVFLGPNDTSKVATSGLRAFISAGSQQPVTAPITMPDSPGTYHVYIDLYAAGVYFAGYQAIEDVVIETPPPDTTQADVWVVGYPTELNGQGVVLSGATVKIDGLEPCITGPYSGRGGIGCLVSNVPIGNQLVTVSAPGYQSWTGPVTFELGKVRTFFIRLYQ